MEAREAQARSWHADVSEHGFATISEVFEADEIEALLAALEQVSLRRSRAGIRHALSDPAIAALARDSRLAGIAREILGDNAFPFRATLFDKSPLSNWLVVWHQDTALPLKEKNETEGWGPWSRKDNVLYAHAPEYALSQVVALRLHLDDSMSENGPLRVLPGTHNSGVLTDEDIHQFVSEVHPMDCLVGRAGVLVMRPLLIHCSSKSRIESPRRVLHIEYASTPRIAEGLELAVC